MSKEQLLDELVETFVKDDAPEWNQITAGYTPETPADNTPAADADNA